MKRSTKLLITATVVASVISVGSVSYAFWSAGTTQKKEITGSAGSINTVGELTVTPVDADGNELTELNALYPVDQGSGTRYWEFDVTVTGDGKQVVTVKGELTKTVKETGSAKLYYSTSAPVDSNGVISSVTASAVDISTAKNIALADSGKTKVYIYMTANNTDAMKATIKLTFEATAAAE